MLKWLFRKTPETVAGDNAQVLCAPAPREDLAWWPGTSLPVPDWSRQQWPDHADDRLQHDHANSLAAAWLDAS